GKEEAATQGAAEAQAEAADPASRHLGTGEPLVRPLLRLCGAGAGRGVWTAGRLLAARHRGAAHAPFEQTQLSTPDPPHFWPAVHAQVDGGRMDGFFQAAQAAIADGSVALGYY